MRVADLVVGQLLAWSAADDVELDHAIGEALQWHGPSLIEARIDRLNYGAILRAVRG